MKAIILAAGLGTRLKPLTDNKPKALVEVNGKTLLQINIEQLSKSGIKDIVINTHHFSDLIKNFLKNHNNFNLNIQISDETGLLLDTGGGIKKALSLLGTNKPVLIQNVDIYSNINYNNMLSSHLKNKSVATLAVNNRESSRYLLFDKKNYLSGWGNSKTGEKIVTRESYDLEQYAFCGIHIVSPDILNLMPDKKRFNIINTYLKISENFKISNYQYNETWFDIGKLQMLNKFEIFLNKK
jgi:NDP-sugar pyrophosphorylase family protein